MSHASADVTEASHGEHLEASRARREAQHRRGTRQLLIARAVFMVLSYISSVILARTLGPAAFGVYGLLIATLVWLEMTSNAGVPTAVGKLIAEHQDESSVVEQSARSVLLASSLLVFAIAWAIAPFVTSLFHIEDGTRLFRLAILDIPFAAAYSGYYGILMGRRQFGLFSVSQSVLAAAKLVTVVVLVLLGMSVAGALVANALSSCAALLYLVVRDPPRAVRPAARFVRRVVALGIPMGTFTIAMQLLVSLDLWFLGALWRGDESAVGHYVAALKIAQTMIVIPFVQSGVVFASVAWALAAKDRTGARRHVLEASRFALILTAPACVIVGTNAPELMGFVYSDAYAAGGAYLALQIVAFSCFAFMDSYAHAVMAAGRQGLVAVVFVAFIPVVAVSNMVLIPRLGPAGAAISLLVGMVGVTIVVGGLVWRHFGPPLAMRTLVRVAIASAVVGIPATLIRLRGPLVLLELAGLGTVYLLVLWLLGEISVEDFALPRVEKEARATT